MQDARKISTPKPKKVKKAANTVPLNLKVRAPIIHSKVYRETKQGGMPQAIPKKRGFKNVSSNHMSNTDPHIMGSGRSEDYRILRHEYLILEGKSYSLDKDLAETDAEARSLEEEKRALLDQLVVLEGLVENGSRRGRM